LDDDTYSAKFTECIDKAKYLFPNDPILLQVTKDGNDANEARIVKTIRTNSIGLGGFFGGTIIGCVLHYGCYWEQWPALGVGFGAAFVASFIIGEIIILLRKRFKLK
jgi:hypothetical protein